jgi:hypothetical protein
VRAEDAPLRLESSSDSSLTALSREWRRALPFLTASSSAGEERQLSQNTLTAYRRTWLKLIAWSIAEGLVLALMSSRRKWY